MNSGIAVDVKLDRKPLTCVSMFSGAMGLDLGLEAAGFQARLAGDSWMPAVQTIRANRPQLPVFDGDVRQLSGDQVRELAQLEDLDLLAGGPPCQSFSTAGKRLSVDDAKNGPLVFEFVRLVSELRPKAFLMENVKGILSAPLLWRELPYNNNGKRIDDQYGALLGAVSGSFRSLGYSVEVFVLNSADFGVPQARQRVFIVGHRGGDQPATPKQTHAPQADLVPSRWVTIREAWQNLPDEAVHCAKFSERKLHYLKMVPAGQNWRALPLDVQKESMGRAFHAKGGRTGYWRRLSLDETSPTVLTEPQNASTSLCHPTEHRPINVREAARLQTFPDHWQFQGRGADQYRLIGNAVPPLLGKAVGESVVAVLDRANLAAAA